MRFSADITTKLFSLSNSNETFILHKIQHLREVSQNDRDQNNP